MGIRWGIRSGSGLRRYLQNLAVWGILPWVLPVGGAGCQAATPPEVHPPDAVYGSGCPEWEQIFNSFTTARYETRKLKPDRAGIQPYLEYYSRQGKKHFLSADDFEPEFVPVVLKGEREWNLLVTGSLHVLQSPTYESVLAAIESTSCSSVRWRPAMDVLRLARFQADIALALQAVNYFGNNADYNLKGWGIDKVKRSDTLCEALYGLLKKTALTEQEISRLPDTRDLGALPPEASRWRRIFLYWKDLLTDHDEANFGCFHSEISVVFPEDASPLFERARIASYIREGQWPGAECIFILSEQLQVLDVAGQWRSTPTTVLVRTARYTSKSVTVPLRERCEGFGVFMLARRGRSDDWSSHVFEPDSNEVAGARVDLPNIPGFTKPYYEVPLKLSCMQCHNGGPKLFWRAGESSLREDSEKFYSGLQPRWRIQ